MTRFCLQRCLWLLRVNYVVSPWIDPHVSSSGDDRVVPMHSLKMIATLQHNLPLNPGPLLIRIDKTWLGHGGGKSTDRRYSADRLFWLSYFADFSPASKTLLINGGLWHKLWSWRVGYVISVPYRSGSITRSYPVYVQVTRFWHCDAHVEVGEARPKYLTSFPGMVRKFEL